MNIQEHQIVTAQKHPMFNKKDYAFFASSIACLSIGYSMMAFDPVENGFGILSLWIAPPLLLTGFALPAIGIIGIDNVRLATLLTTVLLHPWKHMFGLLTFLVSISTYWLTLEPTASLWDCSEFIAAAYKLQVPHTPGTPLSLLIGRIFSLFAFGDVTKVAWTLNFMSALFSALAITLVYYIIYFFGEKTTTTERPSFSIIAASLCGSFCLTFSDTYWFSAVEAEAYGPACFFLLLILSMILTGKDLTGSKRSRRLVLIFYIGGLSYCIHPMCVLSLAVLPVSWFFSLRKVSLKNLFLTSAAGLIIVLCVNRFIAIGLFELAFSLDLFLVNNMSLPFYAGVALLLMMLGVLTFLLLTRWKRFYDFTWCSIFLIVGFTPYLLLFIRSNHNPPIDETNPENLAMIKAYMNRESYPSSPILYGPYFDAQIVEVSAKKQMYFRHDKQYEPSGTMPEYKYEKSRSTILPRLYSNDENHIESYRRWLGLKGNEKPSFSDNLKFLLSYQLGHMYFRYILWNFAGRESDHQNSRFLTPWDGVSIDARSHQESRNQYWMLPLVLVIVGLYYHAKNDQKNFLSVMIFFLVNGLILALYLNSTPNEPRERDYIYIGSYIALCIWLGLGILGLYEVLERFRIRYIVVVIIVGGVPAWMAFQNYDDHDRSGRTFQVDHARNILNSCAPNAILFTGGDNDTFPLWYVQEVEGIRTDVRVVVLSYFNTDWYINQLRKKYYNSKPFQLTLDQKNYRQYGPNDVLYVQETITQGIDVKKFLQLLKEEHKGLTQFTQSGDSYNIVPSKTLRLRLMSDSILQFSGMTRSEDVTREMTLHITGSYLQKNALALIDLIASNNWERPMYFNFTSLNTVGLDFSRYVIQEGNLYRLTTFESADKNIPVDTETSYKNLIEKADYSNLANAKIHFNYEDYHARMISPIRESFNILAVALLQKGDTAKAKDVLLYAYQHLYPQHLRPSFSNLQAAEMLIALDKKTEGMALCISLFEFHLSQLYADSNEGNEVERLDLYLAGEAAEILYEQGQKSYRDQLNQFGRH